MKNDKKKLEKLNSGVTLHRGAEYSNLMKTRFSSKVKSSDKKYGKKNRRNNKIR
jgi:hypothetical protein